MNTVILIGGSVRAAAWSAVRAGWRPWCLDCFADADLQKLCPVTALDFGDDVQRLMVSLALAPPGPVIYTGAMENRPGLVQGISQCRPLLGNPAEVLRRVRCPLNLTHALLAAGLACPAVRDEPPKAEGRQWLVKPRAGAGGRGIRFWPAPLPGYQHYFQEFIDGLSCSAIYLATAQGDSRLLGVTRQLVGEPWLHAAPFHYCGSVGPLTLSLRTAENLQRLGQTLVDEFNLRGLFGVDCVMRHDVPLPVEVNPRYTASIEILESSLGVFALALHSHAFHAGHAGEGSVVSAFSPQPHAGSTHVMGKAIYYARHSLVFPAEGPWRRTLRQFPALDPWPAFADIPQVGTVLAAGKPVLTFFAHGSSEAACLEELRQTARDLDHWLARK